MALLSSILPPVVNTGLASVSRSLRSQLVGSKLKRHSRLHLACGDNVLPGWANIDLRSREGVLKWNLTDPLPVRSESIDYIYCEHFIEHITAKQAARLLAECFRVLQPGGTMRLSTPSLKKLVEEYSAGRTDEWKNVGWLPKTPCQMLNEGMRLWGHEYVYDADELRELLTRIGFTNIVDVNWRESSHDALRDLECRPYHEELILEAQKAR